MHAKQSPQTADHCLSPREAMGTTATTSPAVWECPAPPGHLQECVRPEDNIPSPKALQPQGHPTGPGVAAGVGKAGWPVKQVAGSSWESRMLSWAGRQPQTHGTLRKEDLCPPSL